MRDRLIINALLTGRGNNTFKNKNITNILGKPLMYYPAVAAKNSKYISNFYCSSDDEMILNCASENGYIPIRRPDELALPSSQHVDAIKHAIKIMDEKRQYPDILIVLLCNNATVKTEWIDKSIEMILSDKKISSVCPAERDQDHHPFRAKTIDEKGCLRPFFDFKNKNVSTNRQDLSPCYFLCHNFWTLNIKESIEKENSGQPPWKFLGSNIRIIETHGCFDVHDKDDVIKTEKWLLENNIIL